MLAVIVVFPTPPLLLTVEIVYAESVIGSVCIADWCMSVPPISAARRRE